jgi:hypothetical protein
MHISIHTCIHTCVPFTGYTNMFGPIGHSRFYYWIMAFIYWIYDHPSTCYSIQTRLIEMNGGLVAWLALERERECTNTIVRFHTVLSPFQLVFTLTAHSPQIFPERRYIGVGGPEIRPWVCLQSARMDWCLCSVTFLLRQLLRFVNRVGLCTCVTLAMNNS